MVRNTNPNEKPYDKLNKTLDFWHPEDIGNRKKGEPIMFLSFKPTHNPVLVVRV